LNYRNRGDNEDAEVDPAFGGDNEAMEDDNDIYEE
jgi:hypothetical protein